MVLGSSIQRILRLQLDFLHVQFRVHLSVARFRAILLLTQEGGVVFGLWCMEAGKGGSAGGARGVFSRVPKAEHGADNWVEAVADRFNLLVS